MNKEKLTKQVLRENVMTPMHLTPKTSDLANAAYRSRNWQARAKEKDEALAMNKTAITRPGPYRTGDGDKPIAMRPGADDHLKYKSFSTGGDTEYPRSHK